MTAERGKLDRVIHSLTVALRPWVSNLGYLEYNQQILSTQQYPKGYHDGPPWEMGRLLQHRQLGD